MTRTCDNCGLEIPNSQHGRESGIDTYWCDDCEESMVESAEGLAQRVSDREALGRAR